MPTIVPLFEQIRAERKGRSLNDTGKSRMRIALLKGERLAMKNVRDKFGVHQTSLNAAIKDLERFGYEFDRDTVEGGGVEHWITNLKHVPVDPDIGAEPAATGLLWPASPAAPEPEDEEAVELYVPGSQNGDQPFRPPTFGDTYTLLRGAMDPETRRVSYTLVRDDGLELHAHS